MTDLQVLELQLENNALKLEILNLRGSLAQAMMPGVQQEREALIAQYKAAEAAAKSGA